MPTNIAYRVSGDRAYVALDRPDKLNGLTIEMLSDLARVAQEIGRNRDVRAVILTGNGDAFSTGLDIGKAVSNPLSVLRHFLPLPWTGTNTFQEACWAWRRLPIPVIAVLHGRCYGGALQLALAADFRFTTPDCEMSVMESKWGLVPDMTGAVTMSELIGADRAKMLTMTAETFDGFRAEELGLVTSVVTDPLAEAETLVDRIVTRSPDAVAGAKQLFNRTWSAAPWWTLAVERSTQLRLLLGANSAIARKAVFEKSEPNFEPRALR